MAKINTKTVSPLHSLVPAANRKFNPHGEIPTVTRDPREVKCPYCRAFLKRVDVNGTVTFVFECGTRYDSRGSLDGAKQSRGCVERRHGVARLETGLSANGHMSYGLRDQREALDFAYKETPGII